MATNSSQGIVNLTLVSSIAIALSVTAVDFGTGYVTMGCSKCSLHTPSVIENETCCSGFSSPANGLVLENVGNLAVNITMQVFDNATTMIGGGDLDYGGQNMPEFEVNVTEKELGACPSGGLYPACNNTWCPVNATTLTWCVSLLPDQSKDEITTNIRITIPENSRKGELNTTFIFVGNA